MDRRPRILLLLAVLVVPFGVLDVAPAPHAAAADGPNCGTTVYKASGEAWQCTFSEGFSSSTLDTTKWRPLLTRNTDAQTPECRIKDNRTVALANGVLKLTVRKLSSPMTCTTKSGSTYRTSYIGGGIATNGLFHLTYGRVQFRAAMPYYGGRGIHSALWLWPAYMKYGEKSGELDVAEWRSSQPHRVVPTVHYNDGGADPDITNWACYVDKVWNFHTYTLEWTRDSLRFLYDGKLCLEDSWISADGLTKPAPFDEPYFLILNQALGSGQNAVTSSTAFPQSMSVDYVRVWR
ncbi:glycoside hydrolase family 16 protein [Nocardioides jiangxiensis]|uniref:Glycoside hydrolase family 16 protein n=1 Tax=Nocardioides jiangxiensis TaxID=3064524 RepID=A0ABT9B7K0_9ACTN|nr:glycoside hydrolase family 16 protein [Nocardioides sp. WY-20]MDO7869118.1 glycoside hydrolase family 16 protein [Nocardioides sp. WY-20]